MGMNPKVVGFFKKNPGLIGFCCLCVAGSGYLIFDVLTQKLPALQKQQKTYVDLNKFVEDRKKDAAGPMLTPDNKLNAEAVKANAKTVMDNAFIALKGERFKVPKVDLNTLNIEKPLKPNASTTEKLRWEGEVSRACKPEIKKRLEKAQASLKGAGISVSSKPDAGGGMGMGGGGMGMGGGGMGMGGGGMGMGGGGMGMDGGGMGMGMGGRGMGMGGGMGGGMGTTGAEPTLSFEKLLASSALPQAAQVKPMLEQLQVIEKLVDILCKKVKPKALVSIERPLELEFSEQELYRSFPLKLTVRVTGQQLQTLVNTLENESDFCFCVRNLIFSSFPPTMIDTSGGNAGQASMAEATPMPEAANPMAANPMAAGPMAGGPMAGLGATAKPKTRDTQRMILKDREFDVIVTVEFFEFRKKGEETEVPK